MHILVDGSINCGVLSGPTPADYSNQKYIHMSTQTHQQEVIIQGKIGMLITVRILNASNKCIASTTEFHAYQK